MNYGRITKMGNVKIEKSKMSIGEAKDVENALGNADKFQAFMDYVAACDYPEIFDDEEELGNE
jgi:hypothetical protein